MMNFIWGGMIAIGILAGVIGGRADQLLDAMVMGAGEAVTLCISLGGAYMLWMGLMEVARQAGLIDALARLTQPLLRKLFPGAGQAVAPITLNLAANFFGMGNAATPFGLAAMKALEENNPQPGRATNDMCMFLSLNSSAIELLPTTILAMRTAAGSADPYCVVVPTFISSVAAFAVAIITCKLLERVFP